MKTIFEKLSNFKGSQIIGIDTLTIAKLTGGKSNPMQGKVTKLTEGNVVMMFTSGKGYYNMVNRRLKKQLNDLSIPMPSEELFERISSDNKFTPGKRVWGVRIPDSPFIEHKGEKYLECIFLKPGTPKYFLDGTEISKDKVQGLPIKDNGAQGGLKDKVIIRTFKLKSILKIRKSKKEILGPGLLQS